MRRVPFITIYFIFNRNDNINIIFIIFTKKIYKKIQKKKMNKKIQVYRSPEELLATNE